MIEVVPFRPEHLAAMRVQKAQADELAWLPAGGLEQLAAYPSETALVDGVPFACFGLVPNELGSAALWSFLSADAGPYMLRFTRGARRFLELYPFRRIEANVPCDFEEGCRWLELLGFSIEGPMPKYGPDGSDHYRYGRVA